MDIQTLLKKSKREIDSLDAEILLEFVSGISREKFLEDPGHKVVQEVEDKFWPLVKKRKKTPLAYLIRKKEFFLREYYVDERVLIPRPETEILVEEVIKNFQQEVIIDIGTGSGAIAISLKLALPESQVIAVDISSGALDVARKNASRLGAEIIFRSSDLLSFLKDEKRISSPLLLVANLPYLSPEEITSSLQAEPKLALDGGPDGLDLYRSLFREIISLQKNFTFHKIFCEINPHQAEKFSLAAKKIFPEAQVDFILDFSGQVRVGKVIFK